MQCLLKQRITFQTALSSNFHRSPSLLVLSISEVQGKRYEYDAVFSMSYLYLQKVLDRVQFFLRKTRMRSFTQRRTLKEHLHSEKDSPENIICG